MKLSRITAVLLLSPVFLLFGGVAEGSDYVGTKSFSASELTWERIADYDYPVLGDAGSMTRVGAPALPSVQINVALPAGAKVETCSNLAVEWQELKGSFLVAPATRPRPMSHPAPDEPFIRDLSIYGKNAFYPGTVVEKTAQWDLAGQEFVTLTCYPLQWNPITGRAVLARTVTFSVSYEEDPGAVRKTYNFSHIAREKILARLKRMAANPEDVTLPPWDRSGSRLLPPTYIEYVVITPSTFLDDWIPLVDWSTQRGVPCRAVTTDQIYANYAGGSSAEQIRNFVIDAQQTWGTLYVLLGGDASLVPYHVWDPYGNAIPNDTYYADYDDDWKVEVYTGRASVETSAEVAAFIDKSLSYQKNPPAGFGDKYFFMGFDLDSITPSEECKKQIASSYLPANAVLVTEYDSEGGGHKGDSIAYLNDGQNLINHSDHCGWDVIGVGCTWHGELFYTGDFWNLYNGDSKGLFYSLGCWSLAYDYNDSIGEVWTQNQGGAGIAFVGNSRYGWYAPGYSSYYSMDYDKSFFRVLLVPSYYVTDAGEALGESKNDCHPGGNGTNQYIYQELTLVGDPALPLWTEDPIPLDVTYSPTIQAGLQDFAVHVQCNGTDFEMGHVCVWKGNEVYRRVYTGNDGMARFNNIEPTGSGIMLVTVTAPNRLPHEGECIVTGGSGPQITVDLEIGQPFYFFDDTVNYTIDVRSFSSNSETFTLWTDVTRPSGLTWPPSGYFDGPQIVTLPALGTEQFNFSRYVYPTIAAGTYTINAFVGPDPGVIDEDHEQVDILP